MKLWAPLRHVTTWLRIAAVLTLIALALMVWSVLAPTPLPVMLAMTIGQGVGTLAFAIFGWIVFKDLTRVRRERRDSLQTLVPPLGQEMRRDSLQNIALSADEPAPQERARESLQNIALSKDEP